MGNRKGWTPHNFALKWHVGLAQPEEVALQIAFYQLDNIAGLKLGQEIVARLLPDFNNANYGTSKSVVEQKVKLLRFDWDTFLGGDCAKGLV